MDRSGLFHLADKFKMAGLTHTALRYRRVPNSDLLFWFGMGLTHWSSVWTYGESGMGISLIVTSTKQDLCFLVC